MDLQIDDFYRDISAVLLALYQVFPRKTALYVDSLIGVESPDAFGLPSKRHLACLGAMIWLAEEGYLRYESAIHYEALDQAVLTEKGFLRLSRAVLPASPEAPASIGRVEGSLAGQLRRAMAEGDGERLCEMARRLLVD